MLSNCFLFNSIEIKMVTIPKSNPASFKLNAIDTTPDPKQLFNKFNTVSGLDCFEINPILLSKISLFIVDYKLLLVSSWILSIYDVNIFWCLLNFIAFPKVYSILIDTSCDFKKKRCWLDGLKS